ncbi:MULTISPECIES: hypothetical protein [Enterobacterales]|uniref:Uncharacterized protein n=1 Tax=Mixta intestinalis TaxID=1615494 RepID=A0A6P1PXT9_9GAMM|nr:MULTISPECIES: hypothetical protein [Enterobacterales]MBV4413300.1 hypothetical protein [Tenebrionicola larvae]QHM70679.1 hypothetical protein C7M51_00957 [Mixta intestinalis]CAJ0540720.1 hypothetical protein XXXJIFNMEKO_01116 [Culicoides impunctatus]
MFELDEFQSTVLRQFIDSQWSDFVKHCDEVGNDGLSLANEISVAIGGEEE